MKTLIKLLVAIILCSLPIALSSCEDELNQSSVTGTWMQSDKDGGFYDGNFTSWEFKEDGTFLKVIKGIGPNGDPVHGQTEGKYSFSERILKIWYPVKDDNDQWSLEQILECKVSLVKNSLIKLTLVKYQPECCYDERLGRKYNPLWFNGEVTEQYWLRTTEMNQ